MTSTDTQRAPRTLEDVAPGESGIILQVGNENGPVKRRLVDMGLTPGTEVTVRKIAPFGDPLELNLRGYELSLRKADAAQIRVATGAEGEERAVLSRRADRLGRALDHGWPAEPDLEAETDAASRALAGRLLTAKFVQGLPLVGAVGGAVNLTMYRRVSSYGARKYRKRFLERRAREAGRT